MNFELIKIKTAFVFIFLSTLLLNFQQFVKYEAENMNVIDGPAVLSSDSSMIFWSWGTISFICDLAGNLKLTFRAREDTAGSEHVLMEVKSPGSSILDTLVIDQLNFSDFVLLKDGVSPGNYELAFLNDVPQQKNLHLDYVTVELLDKISDTAKMIVSWDQNSEADLKGYKIYYGLNSRKYPHAIDAGKILTKTIDGLKFDLPYYVAVTAYDTANNESSYSDEVSIVLQPAMPDTLLGDYNDDGRVDFLDMIKFDACFGSTSIIIAYDSYFDFDLSGEIDFADMAVFDGCFGRSVIR